MNPYESPRPMPTLPTTHLADHLAAATTAMFLLLISVLFWTTCWLVVTVMSRGSAAPTDAWVAKYHFSLYCWSASLFFVIGSGLLASWASSLQQKLEAKRKDDGWVYEPAGTCNWAKPAEEHEDPT